MLRPPTNDGSRTKMTVLVNPIVNREQLAQMVFEPLILRRRIRSNCESSSGHATDIALDSDNGVFHLVSIYEGYPLPHIILYLDCVDGDGTDNSTKSRRRSVTASLRLLRVRSSATSRSAHAEPAFARNVSGLPLLSRNTLTGTRARAHCTFWLSNLRTRLAVSTRFRF